MPTPVIEFSEAAQAQTLIAIRQAQGAVVEAVRVWAAAVENVIPPTRVTSFGTGLPTPQEVVARSFDFAEQLLQTQREFAESVVVTAAPVVAKSEPAPAKRTRTKSSSAPAKRTRTKSSS